MYYFHSSSKKTHGGLSYIKLHINNDKHEIMIASQSPHSDGLHSSVLKKLPEKIAVGVVGGAFAYYTDERSWINEMYLWAESNFSQ